MHKERILETIQMLKDLPVKSWHYGTYLANAEKTAEQSLAVKCDTIGCAWGWMGVHFKDKVPGFTVKVNDPLNCDAEIAFNGNGQEVGAAKFLQIPYRQSLAIFMLAHIVLGKRNMSLITKDDVIALLERTLAGEVFDV